MYRSAAAVLVMLGSINSAVADEASYRAKAVAFLAGDGGDQAGSASKYSVKLVDLNGDGVPEALVIDNNPESCGSHGCAADILDLTGPKARSISSVGLLGVDLKVLPTKTGGWRDVALVSVQTTKMLHRGNKYVFSR